MATKKDRIPSIITGNLVVQWSFLHDIDTKFGVNSANHNISVYVTPELKAQLEALVKATGATKVNAYREEEVKDEDGNKVKTGKWILKAKTNTAAKRGVRVYKCVDAASNPTDAVPFGGDTVRLRLGPMMQSDGSLSVYLNGCQIVEKKPFVPDPEKAKAVAFAPVPGGFTDEDTTSQEDDIPF